eukprot:ctg_3151.g587
MNTVGNGIGKSRGEWDISERFDATEIDTRVSRLARLAEDSDPLSTGCAQRLRRFYDTVSSLREGDLPAVAGRMAAAAAYPALVRIVALGCGGSLLAYVPAGVPLAPREAALLAWVCGHRVLELIDWRGVAQRLHSAEAVERREAHIALCLLWGAPSSVLEKYRTMVVGKEEERTTCDTRSCDYFTFWQELEWLDATRLRMFSDDTQTASSPPSRSPTGDDSAPVIHICGVPLPVRDASRVDVKWQSAFLLDEEIVPAVRQAARALLLGAPLLLDGPSGCGKSALLKYLAGVTGSGCTWFQMEGMAADEQAFLDEIGAVVPVGRGRFRWMLGPIGRAIRDGHWLILEGFDDAKAAASGVGSLSGLLYQLAALQPGDRFAVPGRHRCIPVGAGFRLVCTRTTGGDVRSPHGLNEMLLGTSWRCVSLPPVPVSRIREILHRRFPTVRDAAGRMVDCLTACGEAMTMDSGSTRCLPSLHEAVKIGRRLAHSAAVLPRLSPEVCLAHCCDVLAGGEADAQSRLRLMARLAACWSLPAVYGQRMGEAARPDTEPPTDAPETAHLAPTRQTTLLLQRLRACISNAEAAGGRAHPTTSGGAQLVATDRCDRAGGWLRADARAAADGADVSGGGAGVATVLCARQKYDGGGCAAAGDHHRQRGALGGARGGRAASSLPKAGRRGSRRRAPLDRRERVAAAMSSGAASRWGGVRGDVSPGGWEGRKSSRWCGEESPPGAHSLPPSRWYGVGVPRGRPVEGDAARRPAVAR